MTTMKYLSCTFKHHDMCFFITAMVYNIPLIMLVVVNQSWNLGHRMNRLRERSP